MNKNRILNNYGLIWLIALIIFNLVSFVILNKVAEISEYQSAFWTSYIFITIAFIGHLACGYIVFKTDDKTKLFYNIPIINISYTGLVLTLIFGVICMIIPNFPNGIGIIVSLSILAFTVIAVIKARVASDVVENTDTKLKEKTMFIKSLTIEAENLYACARTPEATEASKRIYEAIRYSDPISNDTLDEIESQIKTKFNEFSNVVISGDDDIMAFANELVMMIDDRNKKCRIKK